MSKVIIYLILASVLLSSCKKQLTLSTSTDDFFSIEYFDFEYLSSKAKLKYQNNKQKLSATATFRMKKDSLIWVSISPGLGIEIARLLVTKEGVQLIDKLKRDHYVWDYKTLSELYGIELNFDLVQALVVGNAIFEPDRKRYVVDDVRFFSFSKEDGLYGINQYVGRRSKKLERLIAYQIQTDNSIVINYGDFEKIGNQRAAQKIRARVKFEEEGKEDIIIDIEYSRMSVQKEPLKFPFHVSSRYTRK